MSLDPIAGANPCFDHARQAAIAGGGRVDKRERAPRPLTALIAIAAAAAILGAAPAGAQTPSLAGKTVRIIIGFGPGGSYSAWGRLVARHIAKHLPGNPTVIAQNMPGAGSIRATNYIYNVAPKDGTVMAIVARDAALRPLSGAKGVHFDPTKLSWIGTPSVETDVCIASASSHVKKLSDLYSKPLFVGTTGVGTGTYAYPKALDALLGLKFKIIGGFPGAANIFLAMQRGEVGGVCLALSTIRALHPSWITQHKVALLLQGGTAPDPTLKGVPFIIDLAKTPEQKQALQFLYAGEGFGRPFVAPPGLPPARLKMLRDAFKATMKDPEFLADAKRQKREITPKTGKELAALVKTIAATPKRVVKEVGKLIK